MKPISPQPPSPIDEAFLQAMCQQAASLSCEDLPWDDIEKRVFSQLDDELLRQYASNQRGASRKQPSKRLKTRWPWLVVAPLAAAAAVAGIAFIISESGTKSISSVTTLQTEHENTGRIEPVTKLPTPALSIAPSAVAAASQISFHDAIDPSNPHVEAVANHTFRTTDRALLVQHQAWTAFRLTPNSEVQVKQANSRVELQLLRGKIDATVNLPSASHAFVVHVDSVELSVLGTVFSVDRTSDRLRVQVQKGRVSVAQTLAGAPSRTISIVSAGSAKVFSLPTGELLSEQNQGLARIDIQLPTAPQNDSVFAANGAHPHKPPMHQVADNMSETNALNDTPTGPLTAEQIQPILDSISRQVQACHRTHVQHDTDLTIRASTTIWIQIAPDGHVTYARFVPPLIPAAQTCASRVVQTAKFPNSSSEFSWHWTVDINNNAAD